MDKLRAELKDAVENRGLRNIHFSWAPGAENLTADERAAAVLEWMEEAKRWDAKSDEEKMRIQIRQAYEALSEVIGLCQTKYKEVDFSDPHASEEVGRRSTIFGGIESAMMFLGNWIEAKDRIEIRKNRPKPHDGDAA